VVKEGDTPVEAKSNTSQFTAEDLVLSETGAENVSRRRKILKATYIEDGKPKPLSLPGKSLLLKVENGILLSQRDDGKALAADEADLLNRAPDSNELSPLLETADPVKVGQSWTPQVAELLQVILGKQISESIDLKGAKARMTLKAVEPKAGTPFARVEGTIDLSMVRLGEAKLKKPIPVKVTIEASFAADAISPDRTWKFKLDGKGSSGVEGEEGIADIEVSLLKEVSLKTLK
jgi:hypothetical protein